MLRQLTECSIWAGADDLSLAGFGKQRKLAQQAEKRPSDELPGSGPEQERDSQEEPAPQANGDVQGNGPVQTSLSPGRGQTPFARSHSNAGGSSQADKAVPPAQPSGEQPAALPNGMVTHKQEGVTGAEDQHSRGQTSNHSSQPRPGMPSQSSDQSAGLPSCQPEPAAGGSREGTACAPADASLPDERFTEYLSRRSDLEHHT